MIEAIIANLCLSMASGVRYDMCTKTTQAASMQTNVYQDTYLLENKTEELAHKKVAYYTGEAVLVATGVIAKTAKDRSISYPIKRRSEGFMPAITPTLGIGSGKIALEWRF